MNEGSINFALPTEPFTSFKNILKFESKLPCALTFVGGEPKTEKFLVFSFENGHDFRGEIQGDERKSQNILRL